MPADRSESPAWYRSPSVGAEAEPARGGAGAGVDDQPSSWVRPEPVYYHGLPAAEPAAPSEPDEAPKVAAPALEAHSVDTPLLEEPVSVAAVAETPPAAAPAPARKTTHRLARRGAAFLLSLVLIGGLLVGAGQIFGWFRATHSLSVPSSVGADTLLSEPSAAVKQSLAGEGWTGVEGGFYGSGGVAHMLLLVGRPPQAIAGGEFLPGLASELRQEGYVINPNALTSAPSDGTALACGPVVTANGEVAMCAWTDTDAAGLAVDFSGAPSEQARALAGRARATSER